MKPKIIITAILLLFVAASVIYMITEESAQESNSGQKSQMKTVDDKRTHNPAQSFELGNREPSHVVVAYYFHGTKRCKTCRAIENYTREAIEAAFPEHLNSGKLRWLVLNVDKNQNEHFVDDYSLSTKSVVLSDLRNGKETRSKTLHRVWELVNDRSEFTAYIQGEIRDYLEGK